MEPAGFDAVEEGRFPGAEPVQCPLRSGRGSSGKRRTSFVARLPGYSRNEVARRGEVDRGGVAASDQLSLASRTRRFGLRMSLVSLKGTKHDLPCDS